ncbi:hypothetical protein PMI01_00470, partial [Caulobacter sp. AP07]
MSAMDRCDRYQASRRAAMDSVSGEAARISSS